MATTQTRSNWGKWGAEDERGTLNYITPEEVRRAASLVKKGRVYPLAISLKAKAPLWPGRHENWHVATYRNASGPGPGGAEDILMIHTHGSTHVDALCHVFTDGKMYNGFDVAKSIDARGSQRNAISNIGSIVTRGVLLDVAGFHGVPHLDAGHVIMPDEIEAIAKKQGVAIEPGDALLFRTAFMKVWEHDADRFNAKQPGPSLDVALWAGEHQIVAMAADNSAVEAFPNPDGLVVHYEFLRNQGGYLMELLDLEALAADKVYEFQFVVAPLNIARGLGSPITPLAIC